MLFAAAGEIGAVISEAPEDDVQRLRRYAHQLGMAFQIVDDILDIHSTSEQLGKPIGGDLRQGTVTLPTMLLHGNCRRRRVKRSGGLSRARIGAMSWFEAAIRR